MACIFCSIAAGKDPAHTVYEDDHVIAFLDIFPATRGHCLIVPRQHYSDVLTMPPAQFEAVGKTIQKIAPAILAQTDTSAFNVLTNTGKEAGQVIMHAHWHFIPRKAGDGIAIPAGSKGEPEALAALARALRESIGGAGRVR